MRGYEREGATCVLVAVAAAGTPLRLAAAFAIADPLKPEAPAVIAALRWACGQRGLYSADRMASPDGIGALQQASLCPPADADCTQAHRRSLACSSAPPARLFLLRRKGLRCHMVTGDNWTTARAIAARLGIADVSAEVGWGGVVAGLQLGSLTGWERGLKYPHVCAK